MMIQFMQNILTMILEVLGCFIFYGIFCKKRKLKKIYGIISFVAILTSIYLISLIFIEHFIIKEILIIFVTAVIMKYVFDESNKKVIIISALYQALLLSIDYLALLIAILIFQSINNIDKSNFGAGILIVAFSKSILFFVVLILNRWFEKQQGKILSDREWVRFLFFPIFSIGTIMAMMVSVGELENQGTENIFFVIACGLAAMNVVVFNLLHDIIDRENKKRENEVLKVHISNQMQLYESISDNFDKQQKLAHEYKNNLLCIDTLLARKEYSELSRYMEKLCKKVEYDMDYINTNNVIVNTILNVKYQEMLSKGILFIIKINDLSNIRISDEDIVLILSNILNNAIEACEKCIGDKKIKLKFVNNEGMIILSVQNTFNGIVNMDGERYISTKVKGRERHGIGITNIMDTIKKYDGSYVINNDSSHFQISIMISNKE